jgi:hypothetical protein
MAYLNQIQTTALLESSDNKVNKFGYNLDIDTGTTPEDAWSFGGSYPFPASAASTTIESSSANDTSAGTGARTVRVFGLDASYDAIQEDVTLNGTTQVTLSNQYLRLFRAQVLTAGTTGSNEGNIQMKHGTTVIAEIPFDFNEGNGQTEMAIYTVPNGYTAHLVGWYAALQRANIATDAVVRFQVRELNGAWQTKYTGGPSDSNDWVQILPTSVEIPHKSDIRVRVVTVGANNTAIIAGFYLIEKAN